MLVVPVLDLKQGRAVHAVGGQRHRYQTVAGEFGTGDDPVGLALRMTHATGHGAVYVADLDAIEGRGNHDALVRKLVASGLTVWLDRGVRSREDCMAAAATGAELVILALETLPPAATVRTWMERWCSTGHLMLSVDLFGGVPIAQQFSGGHDVFDIVGRAVEMGIHRVLLLELASVGTETGPAVAELGAGLKERWPMLWLCGGGGVRSVEDLRAVRRAGFDAYLVGTALHRGQLNARALELLMSE